MKGERRFLRRQQLDAQLQPTVVPLVPRAGWITSIRESLGMSLESFGSRLGISPQGAQQLERAEAKGTITINRLRAGADALGCDLVVMIVPRKPLQQVVRERALKVAEEQVYRVGHSMALENQSVSQELTQKTVEELAEKMILKGDPRLWA